MEMSTSGINTWIYTGGNIYMTTTATFLMDKSGMTTLVCVAPNTWYVQNKNF